MPQVFIRVYHDISANAPQVTIGDEAEGDYRIAGHKFSGFSRLQLQKTLTQRDAEEIRNYLDRAFPRSKK